MSDFDRVLVGYFPEQRFAPTQYIDLIWGEYWEIWYSEISRTATFHLEHTRMQTIQAIRGMI